MADFEFTLSTFSHHFVVTRLSAHGRSCVEAFARRFIQHGLEKRRNGPGFIRVALKVFAASTANRREYRFHINQLKEFKESLTLFHIQEQQVEWLHYAAPEPRRVELPIFDHLSDREHQVEIIEYTTKPDGPPCRLVGLQTGKGKSYCSMRSAQRLGTATAFIMRAQYIPKWIIDVKKTYAFTAIEDVMVIQGSASLMGAIAQGLAGTLTAKVFLISNKTIQNWISLYEEVGEATLEMGYGCLPHQLFQVLGVGFRVIDEVHQDFHLNFKIDLYTNVAHAVSLSATMVSDDSFMTRMYEIAYPASWRHNGGALDKYIAAKAIIYRLRNPELIRCVDWATKRYSHNLMEQSILRNKELKESYMNFIVSMMRMSYVKNRRGAGDKLIIFCASINFCTEVVSFLKKKFPEYDIRRYVEDDPYEDLMEPDIRVASLNKAGTAVDVPGLITTILTVAVKSSQSNIQGLGRLRKLDDGFTPEFLYAVCEDIPKHLEYHEAKKTLLQERALSYRAEHMPGMV